MPSKMHKRHRGLSFVVTLPSDDEEAYDDFDKACSRAVLVAAVLDVPVSLDVIVKSAAAAAAWDGADGIAKYAIDPEVTVFERMIVKVTSEGSIA